MRWAGTCREGYCIKLIVPAARVGVQGVLQPVVLYTCRTVIRTKEMLCRKGGQQHEVNSMEDVLCVPGGEEDG